MENTSFGPENVTEGSTNDTAVKHKGFEIFFVCIFFVTYVVGLIGNGIVIFLTGCRMKTTVNSIWFLNLAIADFIYILFSTIDLICILMKSAYLKDFLSITLPLYRCASILILEVISLDRCLCTWMVVWAQNNRTVLKAKIVCMMVWVLSIPCALPAFKIFQITGMFHGTYLFVLSFVIPFLIIVSSNIAIGVRIKRLIMGEKLKSYRLIITVILAFFICSFPYSVFNFCLLIGINNSTVTDKIGIPFIFSIYLFQLNSCLNPFLYVFMCDDYKKKLKQSLQLVLETAFAEDQ